MSEPVILFEKDENVAIITFNRPDKLNSVNAKLRDNFYELIKVIQDDPTIDAVVLSGNGKGFCAGGDLTEFGTDPSVIEKRRIRLQHDLWDDIRRIKQPVAVAIQGFAVGAGLEIAMLCDFRFASKGAVLSLPEASLGMLAAASGTQGLPRLMPQGLALEFALSGVRITAEEGLKKKIISKILAEEELLEYTINYMKEIVSVNNPEITSWVKSLITTGLDDSLEQGLFEEEILVKRAWALK